MDKDNEIEEMATIISCNSTFPHTVIARKIVNKGYGNVKEAVKEFAEELKENLFEVDTREYGKVFVVGEDVVDETYKKLYGEE